jgi:hypothetical protein
MDDLDASRHPDGILRYRRDADGTHVGIIPATCKVCGGALHQVGFRARQHESVMIVDCADCSTAGVPGHAWLLTAPEAAPGRLELDNEPYSRI